ncbi:recombinase RecT [Microbulbifer sp. 2201CG32-9]|uniref:recombinase RecT n=1 Tax=Microbulbifer sp. 2201CG32-9 TaxID=3232309 RepID=UPI00345BFA47
MPKIIDATEVKFCQIAPKALNYQSERGFALQILANNEYMARVAKENPISLQQAITSVASIGLSLNPAERQAYLITRNVKVAKNQWQSRVFLEPSYMGLAKLATDSGNISWVQANLVYANDTFVDNGPGERPTHTYNAFAKKDQRGDFVGVYCVAKTHEGDYLTNIMPEDEVLSIRDRSEAWKSFKSGKAKTGGPWQTDFGEQAKKTVIRRAFKTWPRTNLARMAEAVHLSNENEGFEPILTSPQIKDYTAEQKRYFDQLISQSSALRMLAFQKSLDDSTFTNLYHSFEKGQKGKYQRAVDDLLKSGEQQSQQVIADFTATASSDDPDGILEIYNELSLEEFDFIASRLPAEINLVIDGVINQRPGALSQQ